MSKKSPPQKDIERIRHLLSGEVPADLDSADVQWARRTLTGEEATPPGAAVRPEVAYALVEELLTRREAEILGRLANLEHRTVSKAARTALHRLRSQKVEVELPTQAPQQRPSGTGQPVQQEIQSLVTIYDGRWERLIWIGQDAPSGVQVYQCRVSAMGGLIEFRAGTTSRKEFRSRARSIRLELGGEMIPTELGVWFVEDAARRAHEAGRSLPDSYARASQDLGHGRAGSHPALEIQPSAASPERLLELLELPDLRFWTPDVPFLRRLQLKLDEVATSRLVLNDHQRQERLSAVLDRALEEYFTEQRCQACRQLLLDTAHLLQLRGEERTAGDLRAAAELFAEPPARVVGHRLARGFIERLLRTGEAGPPEDDGEEQEGGGGGLIVPG